MSIFFFFNDTATTEIYTLSLHDTLPIWHRCHAAPIIAAPIACFSPVWASEMTSCTPPRPRAFRLRRNAVQNAPSSESPTSKPRSEEHTSELQSRQYLVCRLLLEKKKHVD